MKSWKFWVGRTLIALSFVVLGLLTLFLGWMGNALVGSYASPAPGARLWFGIGLILLMASGFMYRINIKRWLIGLVGLSVIGAVSFTTADNWSDDLSVFGLAYAVIALGYWLSRR
jgi:hypothetical protein